MTISQAIERCDQQKPNAYADEDKLHWLSKLDGMLYDEVISRHEGAPEAFSGYTAADYGRELLADDAYSDLYVKWLGAQIDYANAEIARYNNAMAMFNALYAAYAASYNRRRLPLQPNYIRGVR